MPDHALTEKFETAAASGGTDIKGYAIAVGREFASPAEAFDHYLTVGRAACPELFPFLDQAYYTRQLDAELPEPMTVFEHYMTEGAQRGLSPMPMFDPGFVRSQAPELDCQTIFEYLGTPGFATVDPHPFFSKRYYWAANRDVAEAGVDAFQHFLRHGWRETRPIHPFFRRSDYLRFQISANSSASDFFASLLAALASPQLALRQPLFDVRHYLRSLGMPDDMETPIQHFVGLSGHSAGSGFPLFDAEYFLSQAPDVRQGVNPYVEYLSDFSHSADPNSCFDRAFYLSSTLVDPQFMGSLLEHFVRIGIHSGARPHSRVIAMSSHPPEGTGWSVVQEFTAASGRQFWLCGPDCRSLLPQLSDINSLEPAISPIMLNSCILHAHTGPVNGHGRLLISTVTKIARCNCLVVSHTPLEDVLIATMHSQMSGLASSARPWLTLLACSEPSVRYSHRSQGTTVAAVTAIAGDLATQVRFVVQAVLAALPNRLAVVTDPLGVALLRGYASQLLTAIPEVVLIIDRTYLKPSDECWLDEFLLVNCCELANVATRDGRPTPLGQIGQSDRLRLIDIQG